MNKNPQRRLVHLQEYVETKVGTGLGYGFAIAVGCVGIVCLLIGLVAIGLGNTNFGGPVTLASRVIGFLPGSFILGVSIGALWTAQSILKDLQEGTPVELITKETAHYLPLSDTLVRASDRPATDQKSELLRAANQGPATPAEQLLRATALHEQDW